MARRDRAAVDVVRNRWSTKLIRNGRGHLEHEGHLLRTISVQLHSTDGLYRIVSRLADDIRNTPGYSLEYLLPEHECNIHLETGVSIRPDASAGLLYKGRTYIQFHLEYEERARYRAGLDAKLDRYRNWFSSKVLQHDRRQFAVPVLFVFPDETIEERFVHVAADSNCCLPILSSNTTTLSEAGFLGRAWRPAWEFRPLTLEHMSALVDPIAHPLQVRRMALIELGEFRWVLYPGRMALQDDELDVRARASVRASDFLNGLYRVAMVRVNSDHEWRGPEALR